VDTVDVGADGQVRTVVTPCSIGLTDGTDKKAETGDGTNKKVETGEVEDVEVVVVEAPLVVGVGLSVNKPIKVAPLSEQPVKSTDDSISVGRGPYALSKENGLNHISPDSFHNAMQEVPTIKIKPTNKNGDVLPEAGKKKRCKRGCVLIDHPAKIEGWKDL